MKVNKISLFVIFCFCQNISYAQVLPGGDEGSISKLSKNEIIEEALPEIDDIFLEGTDTIIPEENLKEIAVWSFQVINMLKNLELQLSYPVTTVRKVQIYQNEFKNIVRMTQSQHADTFVRYTINRALRIQNDIILNENYNIEPQVRLRLLEYLFKQHFLMIKELTSRYQINDEDGQPQQTTLSFSEFGEKYYLLIAEYSVQVINMKARYDLIRLGLKGLAFDYNKNGIERVKNASKILLISQILELTADPVTQDYSLIVRLYNEQIDNLR